MVLFTAVHMTLTYFSPLQQDQCYRLSQIIGISDPCTCNIEELADPLSPQLP